MQFRMGRMEDRMGRMEDRMVQIGYAKVSVCKQRANAATVSETCNDPNLFTMNPFLYNQDPGRLSSSSSHSIWPRRDLGESKRSGNLTRSPTRNPTRNST